MIPILILELSSLGTDILCLWANQYRIPTINLLNFYFYVEFVSIAFIYYHVFHIKRTFLFGLFIFVYSVYFAWSYYHHYIEMKMYSRVPECTMVVAMSLKSFFEIIEDSKNNRLVDDYRFWVNTGFLIYFSNSLFIFLFQHYVLSSQNLAFLWVVHNVFNILCALSLAIAVTKWIKAKKSLSVS